MAEISTIARPYAQAIFELAQEQTKLRQWSDMLQMTAQVAADENIQAIMGNTSVTKAQLTDLFISVCGDNLTDEGVNLIKLLVENRRLSVLPEIAQQFETLKAEAEKNHRSRSDLSLRSLHRTAKFVAKTTEKAFGPGSQFDLQCR
jgi:F-type H+-transporting ATPase subunit delta